MIFGGPFTKDGLARLYEVVEMKVNYFAFWKRF